MVKSKVLVVGGTGYIGKRMVKASLAQGHITYVLQRPEIGLDIDKLQILLSFKKKGARLVEASFSDHQSLVNAVKQVDVVICTMSGVHFRSHNITMQLKLVDAIKEAGNIKRFLPSEFGMDPARMVNALEPGRVTFDEKMVVRKAIEDAKIPFTYVSANCFAGYFVPNLSQLGTLLPPKDKVCLYGDGNVKVLLEDIPIPPEMNKSRILMLAQKRALREESSKQSQGNTAVAVEESVGTKAVDSEPVQVAATETAAELLVSAKRLKRRAVKPSAGEKKKKRSDMGGSFHLVDESSDDSEVEIIPPELKESRGISNEGGLNVGASGSGLPPAGPTPSAEGVEGYTLIRFRSGRGWLGERALGEAPLDALNAFSLSPDKQYLDREDDETLTSKAQEAFGTFGAYFMGALKRGSRSQERYRAEHKKVITERKAKSEALVLVREAQAEAGSLRGDLVREREAKEALQARISQTEELQSQVGKMEEELQVERGINASLLAEIAQLKGDLSGQAVELVRVTETLEKVEQEAAITYADCVQKFKESSDFIDELEEKAGVYHEEGYNDCLKFVGSGSVVDPTVHSIDRFREAELAKYEKEKAEADKRAEAEAVEKAKAEAELAEKTRTDVEAAERARVETEAALQARVEAETVVNAVNADS